MKPFKSKPRKRMKKPVVREEAFTKIFDLVYEHYLEVKSMMGSVCYGSFYRNLGMPANNQTSSGGLPAVEFVADFDLAVKAVTTKEFYAEFTQDVWVYVPLQVSEEHKKDIGKELHRRKMFSINRYLTPSDWEKFFYY